MGLQMYSDTNQTPSFCLTTDTSRHLLRNMSESVVTWAVGLQGMNTNTQTWKLSIWGSLLKLILEFFVLQGEVKSLYQFVK